MLLTRKNGDTRPKTYIKKGRTKSCAASVGATIAASGDGSQRSRLCRGSDSTSSPAVAATESWKPTSHRILGSQAVMATAARESADQGSRSRPNVAAKSSRIAMIAARTTAGFAPTKIV